MSGQNTSRYFGIYRGIVTNNIDPLQLGRIAVNVPAVFGEDISAWALPCAPSADVRFFTVPPVGAYVWIEFEAGNVSFPVWVGCFWGTGEVPDSRLLLR